MRAWPGDSVAQGGGGSAAAWPGAARPVAVPEVVPEVVLGEAAQGPQASLPLAAEGVQRWVWHSRWGSMLIEARDGAVYVNGQPVEPAPPPSSGAG